MKKITDYLAKPLISIFEGKSFGTIKNVTFDENFKYAKWLLVFDEEEIVEENVVALTDVFSVGENAVMIKNADALSPASNFDNIITENNPINKIVYSVLGKQLGRVKDVTIDEKNRISDLLLENENKISILDILSQSESIIIIKDATVKIKVSKLSEKKLMPLREEYKDITVRTMESLNAEEMANLMPQSLENTQPLPSVEYKKAYALDKVMPSRIAANSEFLLGRKVSINIENSEGEVITKKGSTITQKIIDTAHKNNKLKELTANSMFV